MNSSSTQITLCCSVIVTILFQITGCQWEIRESSSPRAQHLIDSFAVDLSALTPDEIQKKEAEVQLAMKELIEMDEVSHDLLKKHLDDSRPSLSVYYAMVNPDVGSVCYATLRYQIFAVPENYGSSYGYFSRPDATGKQTRCPFYSNDLVRTAQPSLFDESSIEEWLDDRRDMTLRQIQIETLEWLIDKEKSIGFQSDDDKKRYLVPLQKRWKELKNKTDRGS